MVRNPIEHWDKMSQNGVDLWLRKLPANMQIEVALKLRKNLSDPLNCVSILSQYPGTDDITYQDVQGWCLVNLGSHSTEVLHFNQRYAGLGPKDLLRNYAFSCFEVLNDAKAYAHGTLPENHGFQRFNPSELSSLVRTLAPGPAFVNALKQWDEIENRAAVAEQALDWIARMKNFILGHEAIRDTDLEALMGQLWDAASEVLEQEIIES